MQQNDVDARDKRVWRQDHFSARPDTERCQSGKQRRRPARRCQRMLRAHQFRILRLKLRDRFSDTPSPLAASNHIKNGLLFHLIANRPAWKWLRPDRFPAQQGRAFHCSRRHYSRSRRSHPKKNSTRDRRHCWFIHNVLHWAGGDLPALITLTRRITSYRTECRAQCSQCW